MEERLYPVLHQKCSKAKGTKCLKLSGMRLCTLPKPVLKLKTLKHLYLNNCKLITDFPLELATLSHLETLDISENHLTFIADSFCINVRYLHILDASYNDITRLPDSIMHLTHLAELNVAHNELIYIPTELQHLPLKELHINNNMLQGLPDGLFQGKLAKSLQHLNASNNQMENMPHTLGNCKHMISMDISNNLLRHLPIESRKLGLIETLIYHDNNWYSGLDDEKGSAYGGKALVMLYSLSL